MHQNDDQFIEVFNRFRTTTHNPIDFGFLNNICLRQPPNELNFPYMYYTNKSTREPNNFVFENTKGQEYVFDANDPHHDTCPKHFKLKNDPSQTTNLHSKIQVKVGMLVEICASNYAIHDGLFNGVDKVFQYVSKLHDS